jgi:chromosome segregation ATPase
MFLLHFNTTIDDTRTYSFAQHEALKTDLEGACQEIDRLRSELEQSRQQLQDLEDEVEREKENVQEMLQEKEVLLEKLLQEKAGLANLKQQLRDIIQKHHEDMQNLEDKTQLLKKGMQEYTALNVKVTSISDA